MKQVLYLHGFASSPGGRKVGALTEILAPRGLQVVAPDLNVPSFESLDFGAIAQAALRETRRHAPAVIVGSSLGAVAALEVARLGAKAPLLLIAPAIGFGRRWTEKLPPGDPLLFFHPGEERELPIHRRFFEDLAERNDDAAPPAVPVVVVMGSSDESVPVDHVRAVWKGWERSGRLIPPSRLLEIAGGDHGLVDHVESIAREILGLAADRDPAA